MKDRKSTTEMKRVCVWVWWEIQIIVFEECSAFNILPSQREQQAFWYKMIMKYIDRWGPLHILTLIYGVNEVQAFHWANIFFMFVHKIDTPSVFLCMEILFGVFFLLRS